MDELVEKLEALDYPHVGRHWGDPSLVWVCPNFLTEKKAWGLVERGERFDCVPAQREEIRRENGNRLQAQRPMLSGIEERQTS